MQVSLTLVNPKTTVKVIDQGADDSVNAASIRRFIARVAGAPTTLDTLKADLIQSRHRVPEEVMRAISPGPSGAEPRTFAFGPAQYVDRPANACGRRLRADVAAALRADRAVGPGDAGGRLSFAGQWPTCHDALADPTLGRSKAEHGRTSDHPVRRTGKANSRGAALHTVEPLVFDDVPYAVEAHQALTCFRSGARGVFMNEIPQEDGSSTFELSDSELGAKTLRRRENEPVEIGPTWYKNGEMGA